MIDPPKLWNGKTFSLSGLNFDANGAVDGLTGYLGSYFKMVNSADYLEYELFEGLRQASAFLSLDDLPAGMIKPKTKRRSNMTDIQSSEIWLRKGERGAHSSKPPAKRRLELSAPLANAALRGTARLWFVVAALGQWIFAVYVARLYGPSAARGDLKAWNQTLFRGYIPGDTIGNATLVVHLLLAVIILFGGPLQFSAKIRRAAPVFHRLNGRLYMSG